MSQGKLDIWISEPGEPCRITDEDFLVIIAHCNGEVLDWCDQEYLGLRAECGHLEVEIPPGCYIVRAVHHGIRIGPGGLYWANWLTDHAIVEVSCDDEKCVRLYSPAAKECGQIFALALQEHGDKMGVDRDLLDETLGNLQELNEQLPSSASITRRLANNERLAKMAREGTDNNQRNKGNKGNREQ